MTKTVSFYSYSKHSGKTTIAFNIAFLLAAKKQRILFIDLNLVAGHSNISKLKQHKLCNTKYYIINNCLHFLPCQNIANKQLEQILIEQKDKYDYFIFDFSWFKNELWEIAIKITDEFVCIFDIQSFVSNELIKTLSIFSNFKLINPNFKCDTVIANKYIDKAINNVTAIIQLKKVFSKTNQLFVLPYQKELDKIDADFSNYAKREFWTLYAIELNKLINLKIKN